MPASARYRELAAMTSAELERVLRAGVMPKLDGLAGFEFRGYNTPAFTALLGIRKFIKGFFRGDGGLEGYNIPARQNGLEGEWLHKPSPEAPKRFGFYTVAPAASVYTNSALLDYGASARNFAVAPERLLRDYLVQVDPANPDILLGKAYLALPVRVKVSYFLLERLRPSSWRP
jgi:hypothetical protein